jgi:hypothetical protein
MNAEEIEKNAKEAGVTPGQYLKQLNDAPKIAEEAAVEVAAASEAPIVKMQHVIITLADGRRGVFMGPELIKEVEFKLGVVPRPVAIDFDPPRAVAVPVPRDAEKVEEAANVVETPNNPEVAAPEARVE